MNIAEVGQFTFSPRPFLAHPARSYGQSPRQQRSNSPFRARRALVLKGKVKSARKASDICGMPTFALAQTPERALQLPAFIARR